MRIFDVKATPLAPTVQASKATQLTSADAEREAGNAAFQAGRHHEAAQRYEAALTRIEEVTAATPQGPGVLDQARSARAAIFGNLAACHLKAEDYDAAIEASGKSLAEKPSNSKVLYRRAVAYRKKGALNKAHEDLCAALELEPSNVLLRREIQMVEKLNRQATGRKSRAKLVQDVDVSNMAAAWRGPFYAGVPHEETTASHESREHPTLTLLKEEVSELREASPLGLLSVGEPRPAPVVNANTQDREQLTNQEGHGPWLLELYIHGPPAHAEAKLAEPGAYDTDYCVELCIPPAYPNMPPRVRFRSIIHHTWVEHRGIEDQAHHHERRLGQGFYEDLIQLSQQHTPGSRRFCLWAVCELLYRMLDGSPGEEQRSELWKRARRKNWLRLQTINTYRPQMLHPALFDASAGWQREWLDPALAEVLLTESEHRGAARDARLRDLITEEMDGVVYSFDLFSPEFCEMLCSELDHFQAVYGGDFAANYYVDVPGKFINNIGFEPMAQLLLRQALQPISALLFPKDGAQLDSIHCFIMRYRGGEDQGLDMHRDSSDVSFTVCLGRPGFSGGHLNFCGFMAAPDHRKLQHRIFHKTGRCIAHLGTHRHGCDPTIDGERVTLVIWTQSIAYRTTREYVDKEALRGHLAENSPPDQECLSWANDRDFGVFKPYPKGSEEWRGEGWCPPPGAEYHGFRPETSAAR